MNVLMIKDEIMLLVPREARMGLVARAGYKQTVLAVAYLIASPDMPMAQLYRKIADLSGIDYPGVERNIASVANYICDMNDGFYKDGKQTKFLRDYKDILDVEGEKIHTTPMLFVHAIYRNLLKQV